MFSLSIAVISKPNHLPFFFPQVWFQNRRARTLKCRGAKKALWKSELESPTQEFSPPHTMVTSAPESGSVSVPPQGPPPGYHTQVKEEVLNDYFWRIPQAYSTPVHHGHYGTMYHTEQDQYPGSSSSPSMTNAWAQPEGQTSPVPSFWCPSPPEVRNSAAFLYPGSADYMSSTGSASNSSPPDTPDSGYWGGGQENSPPQEDHYPQVFDSWQGYAAEGSVSPGLVMPPQHAPLPELSVHEILRELGDEESW